MNHLKVWSRLMQAGNLCGCHQRADRSFFYQGYQFPLCARCTGIFIAQPAGILLYLLGLRPSVWLCVFLILIMAVDGTTQYFKWQTSNNTRRLLTGLLAGYGYITLVIYFLVWLF